jgi:hypothetical protein
MAKEKNIGNTPEMPDKNTGLSKHQEIQKQIALAPHPSNSNPAFNIISSISQQLSIDEPLTQINQDNKTQIEISSYYLTPNKKEIIYALGECGDAGINLLQNLATDFYQSLINKTEPRENINNKRQYYKNDEFLEAANLALAEITKLHQQHIYPTEKFIALAKLINQFVRTSPEIINNNKFWPNQRITILQGVRCFLTESLNNPKTSKMTWETIKENLLHNSLNEDNEWEISKSLFLATNQMKQLNQDQIDVLLEYISKIKPKYWFNYDSFHPELFFAFTKSNSSLRWKPEDIQHIFHQKEGATHRLFNLITRDTDAFKKNFNLLFGSIIWSSDQEYQEVTQKLKDYRKQNQFLLPMDTIYYCMYILNEYPNTKTDRFFDWFQFIAPDLIANISSIKEYSEEDLAQIIFLYKGKHKVSPSNENYNTYMFLPIVAEKALQFIITNKTDNLSCAAGLIVEIQLHTAGKTEIPEPAKHILSKIRIHLHNAEGEKAAEYVREIFLQNNDENGFNILLSDPEVRSKLEIIRKQICPEINITPLKEQLIMAINTTRNIDKKGNIYKNQHFVNLFQELEDSFRKETSPTTIIQAIKKIKNYSGDYQNYLLPLIIRIRKYFLDQGVLPPKNITPSLWLKTAMDIAVYTGEIKPETQFLWRHSTVQKPNKEKQLAVLSQLRSRYKQLNVIQNYLKTLFPNNLAKATDEYRNLTSRSLIDWIYRAVQNSIEE